MSDLNLDQTPAGPEVSPDRLSSLFQAMVMQQANMALMFLGHVPHPETGQTTVDLNAARFFIDQLEMLEAKTKGNLSRHEETLLKQNLMNLRMAFVEAADRAATKTQAPAPPSGAASQAPAAADASTAQSDAPADTAHEESRKKFSKKY